MTNFTQAVRAVVRPERGTLEVKDELAARMHEREDLRHICVEVGELVALARHQIVTVQCAAGDFFTF